MPLRSGKRRREDEHEPARTEEPAPPTEVQRVLAMQRTAGNQAVAATLQRKVKIGDQTPPTVSHKAKVPAVPDDIRDAYDAQVLAQITARAQDWVVHKDLKGEYATTLDFYKAVAKEVAPGAAPEGPSKRGRWEILKAAVQTDGKITAVPWTRFNDTEAPLLEAELLNCPVQIAGSGRSTAAHGNKHGKLPKPVALVDGKTIDHLEPKAQMDKTPYFEFLISGGHKKNSGGIERGIIDMAEDRIFITAHYDKGSLAELVGVPASVVADWKQKVTTYKQSWG